MILRSDCKPTDEPQFLSITESVMRHRIMTFVAGLTLSIGLLGWVVWDKGSGVRQTMANDLRDFEAKTISRTEMLVTVRYSYAGDRGLGNIYVAANGLHSDGSQFPDVTSSIAPVRLGQGMATVKIRKHHGASPETSGLVKVCMQEGTGKPFYCKTFPYTKSWSYNSPGGPPRHNEIGCCNMDRKVSRTSEIGVKARYAYTGNQGSGVRMMAYALREDGSQVPGTDCIPVKVNVGYGKATVMIRKRTFDSSNTKSISFRVCLVGMEDQPFCCEEFTYPQLWQ